MSSASCYSANPAADSAEAVSPSDMRDMYPASVSVSSGAYVPSKAGPGTLNYAVK